MEYWKDFGAAAFNSNQAVVFSNFTVRDPSTTIDPEDAGSNGIQPGDGRRAIAMGSISTVVALGEVPCCVSLKIRRDAHQMYAALPLCLQYFDFLLKRYLFGTSSPNHFFLFYYRPSLVVGNFLPIIPTAAEKGKTRSS